MHIVVTGASSGIGEAIAREMARVPGAKLTIIARRREKLEALAKELGGSCLALPHDLSDATRATAWVDEAERVNGPIDVMVNNAGVENTGWAAQADVAGGLALLSTNLVTPVLIARALAPKMIERRSGTIVNVASVAAYAAVPLHAWYGASKSGIATFSEVLRAELARHGVHVVTVYPGPITTPMAETAYAAFGGRKGIVGLVPEGNPPKLARLVRHAIERRRKRVIYPSFFKLGWYFPWLSRWIADRLKIEAH